MKYPKWYTNRELFPKGQEIVVAFNLAYKNVGNAIHKRVSYTEDDDKVFFLGIIPQDTIENGLSVVSIENPNVCFISLLPQNILGKEGLFKATLEELRSGYVHCDRLLSNFKEQNGIGGVPSCQYK